MKLSQAVYAIAALSFSGLCSCSAVKSPAVDLDNSLAYCHNQVHKSLSALRGDSGTIDYSMIPRNISDSSTSWHCRPVCPEEWCSGFWPGVLWYDYENTGDKEILAEAEKYTDALRPLVDAPVYDHDLGFTVFLSYGNAYRLTGKEEYRKAVLAAADSLATLFNPTVGTILSWPRNVEMFGGHNTIMDNMMNLEMLFWASKNGGNSYLYDIAFSHAEKTMQHHFRDDYSAYHVSVYNPETGDFIRGCNHQGYDDNSMWARGQAWAIYGYTMTYRETSDRRFLDFAQKVADRYLSDLPDDMIPYWDFDDPARPESPKDASAACVVASSLLELSSYIDGDKSKEYYDAALKMLASLESDKYRSGNKNDSFLLHSVGNYPAGSEIDYSIVYADYYYLEALTRLKGMKASESNGENKNFMASNKR